jgi:hypothetical protein
MARHVALAGCLLALGIVGLGPRGGADEPKADGPPVGDVALETAALRTLYYLKVSPEQLKHLQKLAPQTMEKARERKGKASKEVAEALGELRDALAEANDDDRIDELQDRLDQLRETQNPELDDDVTLTDAARKQVPDVLRRLKPSQVANYLGQVADDLPDPRDLLTEALAKVRRLKGDAWEAKRDEVAEEVSLLVGGLDRDRVGRLRDRVVALLATAHSLTDDEFKGRQAKLEEQAQEIVGDIGPTEVVRHEVEHALARLLSNPRLAAAVEARLK